MALIRPYRPIRVENIPDSKFKLLIEEIDFEIKLYDKFGLKFSVDTNQINDVKLNGDWPPLFISVKYVLRYNNNNGGIGNLDARLIQLNPDGQIIELDKFSYFSINGPTVFEIPFYITY